jgi:hypothetical protein
MTNWARSNVVRPGWQRVSVRIRAKHIHPRRTYSISSGLLVSNASYQHDCFPSPAVVAFQPNGVQHLAVDAEWFAQSVKRSCRKLPGEPVLAVRSCSTAAIPTQFATAARMADLAWHLCAPCTIPSAVPHKCWRTNNSIIACALSHAARRSGRRAAATQLSLVAAK